jgi:crotonobetainyl-CoA:carnitine CoA-transferase CaiB-like acyl-CoA transferase
MSDSAVQGSSSPGAGWQPLRDVKVADFSLLLPGPFATLTLADLGADVVKIEPREGDFARRIPFAMFRMANRNKRSLALDLKHKSAPRIVAALARWADVALEGFRPGVAERLGIDHATLARHNPRLVYCALSGYGQTGPDRLVPGHDLNYLAASGALALAGHWPEPPRRSGLPVADLAGGCYAAIAIAARAAGDRKRRLSRPQPRRIGDVLHRDPPRTRPRCGDARPSLADQRPLRDGGWRRHRARYRRGAFLAEFRRRCA